MRDDERAVDAARRDVARCLVVGVLGSDEQTEHVGRCRDAVVDARDDRREVRISEEAHRVLRHDERDRVRLPGGQRAGSTVRHVVQLGDRLLDRRERLRAHAPAAVDDARHGRPGHAGAHRHLLERRGPGVALQRHRWLHISVSRATAPPRGPPHADRPRRHRRGLLILRVSCRRVRRGGGRSPRAASPRTPRARDPRAAARSCGTRAAASAPVRPAARRRTGRGPCCTYSRPRTHHRMLPMKGSRITTRIHTIFGRYRTRSSGMRMMSTSDATNSARLSTPMRKGISPSY